MLGFTGDGAWAHLAAYASMDEISPGLTMEHGTWLTTWLAEDCLQCTI